MDISTYTGRIARSSVYRIASNLELLSHASSTINHHSFTADTAPNMKLQDEAMTGSQIPDDALRTKKDFKPGDPNSRGMNNEEKRADKARREGKSGEEANSMCLPLDNMLDFFEFCSFLEEGE